MLFKTIPSARGLAAALAASAFLALLAAPAQAQIKLRYAHVGVANAPQTLYADEVAKLVKERTAGRVEIQVFANSQLGGVGEMVDGVKSGAVAMGHHDFASLGKILPTTAVFNTPFAYRDAEHALRVVLVARDAAATDLDDERQPLQLVDGAEHVGIARRDHRVARRLLVAAGDEAVQRQRVGVRHRRLLLDEHGEHAGFDGGQRSHSGFTLRSRRRPTAPRR